MGAEDYSPMENTTAAALLVQTMLYSAPKVRDGLTNHLQNNTEAGAEYLKPYFIAAMRMLKKAEKEAPDMR